MASARILQLYADLETAALPTAGPPIRASPGQRPAEEPKESQKRCQENVFEWELFSHLSRSESRPIGARWFIILAALLVAVVVVEAIAERSILLPILVWMAQWSARTTSVPIGLLMFLPLLGAGLYGLRRWRKELPRLEHYTRDKIGGVLWEWEWELGDPTPIPNPICPQCLRPMRVTADPGPLGEQSPPADRASCVCGYEQTIGRGGDYLSDLFKVEVDRRVRIGYWQEALERWGRRGQPIPQAEAAT